MAAQAFAQKLNQARGPVKVIVPLKGWSSVDTPGSATYDPAEDSLFTRELGKLVKPGINIVEVDANMEDGAFADIVIRSVRDLFPEG